MENEPIEEIIDSHGYTEHGNALQLASLYGAIAEAQGAFERIHRNRAVRIQSQKGSYSFDYAEMDEINDACKAVLKATGLACVTPFSRPTVDSSAFHHLVVSHKEGGRIHVLFAFVPGTDVKDLGGQTTYIMRYLFSKFWRLHAEGDADDMPTRADETGAQAGPRQAGPMREPPKPAPRPQAAPAPQAGPRQAGPMREPPKPAPRPQADEPREAPKAPEVPAAASKIPKPASVPPAAPEIHVEHEPDAKPSQAIRSELRAYSVKLRLTGAQAEQLCQQSTGVSSGQLTQAGAAKLLEVLRQKAGE